MSDLILSPRLPKKAALAALKNDRPLIRWAAHSARISDVGHAPDLLRVRLEEEVEQALAEAVRHPLLEGVLLALGLHLRPQVGEERARQLDRAELLDHVGAAQRVVEELAVPEDARHARALEEVLAHDLVPEVVDLLGLGEEAVAAEVEAVAVADRGLGDAADLVLGLEDDHGQALLGEQVAGGQPGRARRPGSRSASCAAPGAPAEISVLSFVIRFPLLLVEHAAHADPGGAPVVRRHRPHQLEVLVGREGRRPTAPPCA